MKILMVCGVFVKFEEAYLQKIKETPCFDAYIGVDRGAYYLARQDFQMLLSIGDFDSVAPEEIDLISLKTRTRIQLPKEKDETDLEAALLEVFKEFPRAEVTILGGFGRRLDHFLTNIFLPTCPQLSGHAEQIVFLDETNFVQYLSAGQHQLTRKTSYQYIGFAQVDTASSLSITGAKYDLQARENFAEIYASNEFVTDFMNVKFDQGFVIVIYSKDENK